MLAFGAEVAQKRRITQERYIAKRKACMARYFPVSSSNCVYTDDPALKLMESSFKLHTYCVKAELLCNYVVISELTYLIKILHKVSFRKYASFPIYEKMYLNQDNCDEILSYKDTE